MSVRREEGLDQHVKPSLPHQLYLNEWQPCQQFLFGRSISVCVTNVGALVQSIQTLGVEPRKSRNTRNGRPRTGIRQPHGTSAKPIPKVVLLHDTLHFSCISCLSWLDSDVLGGRNRNRRTGRTHAVSCGKSVSMSKTQSTSLGSRIAVVKLPFTTSRFTPARRATSTNHRSDSIWSRRNADCPPNLTAISSRVA